MNKLIVVASLLIIAIVPFRSESVTSQEYIHPLPTGLTFRQSSSISSDDNGLFYMHPETHEITKLLDDELGILVWSPDGLHFASINYLGHICIYTANWDEEGCIRPERPLYDANGNRFPIAWSIDSQYILVLLRDRDGSPQLVTINVSSQAVQTGHTLQLNGEILQWIHWSPNGQHLAYQTQSIAEQQASDVPNRFDPLSLYLMNIQSGETRLLSPWSHDWCVSWSNDGQYLGAVLLRWFDRELGRLTSGLTIFDTDGDIANHIQPHYAGYEVFGCPFSWSPDNKQIAYFSDYLGPDGKTAYGIFTISANNPEAYFLADVYWPPDTITWSPDGTHIAIGTLLRSAIRILSLDGWEWVYEDDATVIANPSWQPPTDQ